MSSAREQIAKGRPSRLRTCRELKPRETLLERAQRPACLDGQVLDGLAGLVERADIAELDRLPVPRVDPPEGKALGSADVRALRIDSTGAFAIEESAGPFDMRSARAEKLGVVTANELGLHVEDRQPIHAA
jgi:hypothetical protein